MNDTAQPQAGSADRQAFYHQISEHSLAPLWERLHSLVTRTPNTPAQPALWDYDNIVRPYLMQAGGLITAREAERRVLILENPGMKGQTCITHSLFAGLQLILPGEIAPAHRHAQSALRFIIEGHGAYTAVEGERTLMEPGDFVITPSWTWHDHGNETDQPMVWLDGLDIPIVRLFDASFAEPANADSQSIARPVGDSLARFGANMVPIDWKPARTSSPVFSYPYARSREALATLARNGDPDPWHGYKLRYINPASGGAPMPTIGAFMTLLPSGFATAPYRSTDGTVYAVVEGEGETVVGDTVFRWKPRDLFVVPGWHRHHHRAASEAVLFSFSDRPVQDVLSLWREERLDG
jgi:gentisate 1,2-dioxygenase